MGKHASSFEEKVEWLCQHPQYWKNWPCATYTDDEIIEFMRKDALVSAKANNYDIGDFGKLIAEARSRNKRKARKQ